MSKLSSTDFTSFYTPRSLRRKILWLINLRWIATAGMVLLILLAANLLENAIPLRNLIITVSVLGAANLIYILIAKQADPSSLKKEMIFVRVQIYLDLFLLSILIHLSGGIHNPFYLFYIFHVIIASTIFEQKKDPYAVTIFSVAVFTLMVLAESKHWILHYNLFGSSLSTLSVLISLGVFYLTMFSSAYLGVTLMGRHLKVKDIISQQNKKLKQASEVKTKFFRFVSHELKSPIVAIQSSINVVLDLLGNELTPKTADMLTRAKKRSAQMLDILKDLLDIMYDRQLDEAKPEKVIPCDFLKEFIDNELPHAQEKGVTIVEKICAERGDLKLDKFILEKIFSNLLSNAVRYTPKNGVVTISTSLENAYWSFTISDTGIGISSIDQKHIFDEFYRTKNAKHFEAVGTGLGLSIVKNLVDQLDGEILIESEVNKGSTFTVKIPL
ncbi:MAG: HAMP domain-containing histidine kinase [Candidatus Marinimicrobia bacterium]|nr:HAMP domain-containing histidine kinase [Candidatus Neomarinimicrobiota bacterium]MBL7059904.1 HAMP domain-containing histidine kinase [Candidatus Neomarinimicrobiota bacterium]